jgi:hypothetical protein
MRTEPRRGQRKQLRNTLASSGASGGPGVRFDRREQDAGIPASESTVISVVLTFEIACSANSRVGIGETFQFEKGNSAMTNYLKSQDGGEEEEGHMGEVKPSAADIAAKLRREERKKKQTAWYSSSSSDDETYSGLPSEPAHHRSWGGAFRALYLSFQLCTQRKALAGC